MQRALVMTIIGPDRPGLVDSVATLVAEHGGNWVESRMSRLGGQFAGILRVEVPTPKESALVAALQQLAAKQLTVIVHPDRIPPGPPHARLSRLELVGQDRPGIIRQISHALLAHGVNVEELETERSSAPMSGENLFRARARLGIPARCDLDALRKELEKIAADLIVELSLAEMTVPGSR